MSDIAPKKPVLQITSDAVAKAFAKKMGSVAQKQREVDTMRFASAVGAPHIDLERFPVTSEALRVIDKETALTAGVVCFFATTEEIRLGALDPQTEAVRSVREGVEKKTHARVGMYVISQKSLDRVLQLYATLPVVKAITKDVSITAEALEAVSGSVKDFSSLQEVIGKSSTSDSLIAIMGAGFKLGSSDVHVEAEAERIVVRFRLDGILHDAATVSAEAYRHILSRLKLLSSLKINITDKPQDGRFTIKLTDTEVDVRVSTIPTVYGESVVMRLLRQNRKGLTLDALGLRGHAFEILKQEIARPNGMIVTTGPTGSGKTTTLYAVMQILNTPDVKILTLEDPVEYKMPGVNQSQIDAASGYTFAKGLRSLLRQDPDIVMVGEIRDFETADTAVQAALTGHLMLSTIHTNSAAGAVPRFLSMGVKPFLLAPALNCVMGQRLVRRLCTCKKPISVEGDMLARVEAAILALPEAEKAVYAPKERKFFGPGSCEACSGLGYKGQMGVYEVLSVDDQMKEMIVGGSVSEVQLEAFAKSKGMVSMLQDGIMKSLDAETSLDEVFRVTG